MALVLWWEDLLLRDGVSLLANEGRRDGLSLLPRYGEGCCSLGEV